MIDSNTLVTAKDLKAASDAAYLVFKKNPSVANAGGWATANRAFTDFCVKTIEALIDENTSVDVTLDIEKYRTCKQCGSELLFFTDANKYIASSDFLEDFPGWCYTCLAKHCSKCACEVCNIPEDHTVCSFASVKKLLSTDE
jgi:hypothetical protein